MRDDNLRQFALVQLYHQSKGHIGISFQTVVYALEDELEISDKFVDPVVKELKSILSKRKTKGCAGFCTYGKEAKSVTYSTMLYTFYEAVTFFSGSNGTQRGKYKSAYMKKAIPDDQVETIYRWLTWIPKGLSKGDMMNTLLQIDSFGGKINTVAPEVTAYVHRSSIMIMQFQTYWDEKIKDVHHSNWLTGFYTDLYKKMGGTPNPSLDANDVVDGCYYNYPDSDLKGDNNDTDQALRLYFGVNLPHLKSVKQRWDPQAYFNKNWC